MAIFSTSYALMICSGLLIALALAYKYNKKSIINKLGLPLTSVHLLTILLSYKVLMICAILSLFILLESAINTVCDVIKKLYVLPNLQQEIADFANSDQRDIQQFGQDMQQILNQINTVKATIDQGKQELAAVKQDLNSLNTSTHRIICDAYQSLYPDISGEILDEAQKALQTEGEIADKIAEDLSKKPDDVSKEASVVISNIIGAIIELTSIKTGAYQQVKHLKAEFNKHLTELSLVASNNENLIKEFGNVKNNIMQSFRDVRWQRTELSDFKKEIASHIQAFNASLERFAR